MYGAGRPSTGQPLVSFLTHTVKVFTVSMPLHLNDLRLALEAQDPELVSLIETLAAQPDEPPKTPVRQGALTLDRFLAVTRSRHYRRQPADQQAHYRREQWKALEAPDADVPLPDRLRLHEIILALWRDNSVFARTCLLRVIDSVKLTYGPWRALKQIFKEAETRGDTEVYGALAARFDAAHSSGGHAVSGATLTYLARRAWRFLRRIGVQLPVAYADTAADCLARYTDSTDWNRTWVANHIFYHHEKRAYNRSRFVFRGGAPKDLLKSRAFADLWRRSPRPLFALLERARSDKVRQFAAEALKADFRAQLREVEPAWVARLVSAGSGAIDDFVVWILTNVPRFEQGAFRALGLHDAVLRLFDSPSEQGRAYAADYARTHARDLPVPELVRLVDNTSEAVRKLALDLLGSRDPRTEIGLEAWGWLLETTYGHDIAAAALRKHFGAKELTPVWFKERLYSPSKMAFQFTHVFLLEIHPADKLGVGFFTDLIDSLDTLRSTQPGGNVPRTGFERGDGVQVKDGAFAGMEGTVIELLKGRTQVRVQITVFGRPVSLELEPRQLVRSSSSAAAGRVVPFALKQLAAFDVNTLDREFLQRLIVNPATRAPVCEWIDEGRLKVQTLPLAFWKALAFRPDWEADAWLDALRRSERPWAQRLEFDEALSSRVLAWLGDVRRFSPAALGLDWLMRLVESSEPRYHDFAVETMIKGFVPADFAEKQAVAPVAAQPVNLAGASFLFTGKMATMPRKEAEDKVKQNGGANVSSVTKKLHYLVIGDEGSSLYSGGKKGDKQLKAEQLNAAGANIRIISETAFLQMLAGTAPPTASADTTLAGCEALWRMAVAPGPAEARRGQFARQYILRHHPDIGPDRTSRPVDPGAEIPLTFLTFGRVEPLFGESRKPLRDFVLELARWEFTRWNPSTETLLALSELPHADVRQFVAEALLAEPKPENRRFRVDPDTLAPEAVYRFCESTDADTRKVGMQIIRRSPRLQVPEEMFRLTESPDRLIRGFVIRSLWALYRDRGVTADWKPPVSPAATLGAAAKKAAAQPEPRGPGVPHRPEQLPAGTPGLSGFLRRVLFEVPPGRPEPPPADTPQATRLKPLPARRAKLELVEMMRDLALEDAGFAAGILPLLEEFMTSRGQSERAACLVAVTRIRHTHAALGAGNGEVSR
jgi:hypothetical protein